MAGLLEKDIRLLWGTKQTLVILFAIAVAVAFSGNVDYTSCGDGRRRDDKSTLEGD